MCHDQRVCHREICKHIELIGACYPEERAEGPFKFAIGEVQVLDFVVLDGLEEVVDRPGEAGAVCEVIITFVGRRHQYENMSTDNDVEKGCVVERFILSNTKKGWAMVIEG